MAYVPFVPQSSIKLRLKSILNFDGVGSGGFNSFEPNAGGDSISDEELLQYQAQAEQLVVRKLGSLYKIPLTSSVNSGITLDDFEDNTRYVLEGLFITRTCKMVLEYNFPQQAVKARMLKDYLTSEYTELLGLIEKVDKASGRVYPAFEDLVWSEIYLTRQETPVITATPVNNEASNLFKDTMKGL